MLFLPTVMLSKNGDNVSVAVRHEYSPRGIGQCPTCGRPSKRNCKYQWRSYGEFSLKEFLKELEEG